MMEKCITGCGKDERVMISYRASGKKIICYKVHNFKEHHAQLFEIGCVPDTPIISVYKGSTFIGNVCADIVNLKIKEIIINRRKDGTLQDLDVVI